MERTNANYTIVKGEIGMHIQHPNPFHDRYALVLEQLEFQLHVAQTLCS